jgi:5-(carboxyamino)imidazole ribonucleotide synthase
MPTHPLPATVAAALTQTIGVLGAGQLGLMLQQAAVDYCLDVRYLDADPTAPAGRFAKHHTVAPFTDEAAVYAFGQGVDVLTIEIENVSVPALLRLQAEGKRVYPQPEVLAIIQDKLAQKKFYVEHGLPTGPFVEVQNKADVARALADMGPAYQKLARGGYDGRGVQYLAGAQDLDKAFDAPGYLEAPAQPVAEVCVLVARSSTGEVRCWPAVESVSHAEANMVDYLLCPARISPEIEAAAEALARRVAEAFGVVGLLAVELFVTPSGQLWVNECAPRPHNTGHHTIEASPTSQFAQLWRAILGLPLGSTAVPQPAAMLNVVGPASYTGPAIYPGLEAVLQMDDVYVHLYGKAESRPFRKMGHITVLGASLPALEARIAEIKAVMG